MKPTILVPFVVLALSGLTAQGGAWQPLPGHSQVRIWPGVAPDPQPVRGPEVAETDPTFLIAGKPVVGVRNVTHSQR
jgi:hypothetical protein